MSRRVTRRELLAGITAAGAAGTLSGVGTAALLVDRETLAASAAAGSVDIQFDLGNGPVDATGGAVALPLPGLDAGESGRTTVSLLLPDTDTANPAYLWLRAACGAETTLGPYLRLTVSRADGDGATLFDGTLTEFDAAFGAGVPLDASGAAVAPGAQTCVDPGSEIQLDVRYELSDGYIGEETASILLQAAAVQCRHVEATTRPPAFDSPLGLESCVPACPCCTLVGKYEIEDDTLVAGQYAFTEGSSAYLLDVSNVVTNDDGEPQAGAFGVVLADDPSTSLELCRLVAKAGPNVFVDEDDDGVVSTDGQSISHVTVGICTAQVLVDGALTCPENLVTDPSLDAPGNGGGGGKDKDANNGGRK